MRLLRQLQQIMKQTLFQSTHPRGVRRHNLYFYQNVGHNFNPRTREGCDARAISQAREKRDFNPRTREGCDGYSQNSDVAAIIFQSTHPRGVRRLVLPLLCQKEFDFNPRTREGCDICHNFFHDFCIVFQSTHPRGVRQTERREILLSLIISIHAPARGATYGFSNGAKFYFDFNPRTREGCDFASKSNFPSSGEFQSTHPRGVRLLACPPTALNLYISIHAPARGATCNIAAKALKRPKISIHAPARGATRGLYVGGK